MDSVFIHPPIQIKNKNSSLLNKITNFIKNLYENNSFLGEKRAITCNFSIMPMGLISLASCLEKEGYSTKIYNIALETEITPFMDIEKKIKSIDSNVYFIDLHWNVHSRGAIEIAQLCKKLHPNSQIVLGGLTASWYYLEIMNNYTCVDYIIQGEAENVIGKIMNSIKYNKPINNIPGIVYRKNSYIKVNKMRVPPTNLDIFDFTNVDLIEDYQNYFKTRARGFQKNAIPSIWLPIARGCKYNCIYCGGGQIAYSLITGRKKICYRKPIKIVDDIQKLYEKGVKMICFSHDPQMAGSNFFLELFQEVRKRHIDIGGYLELFNLPSDLFLEEYHKTFTSHIITVSPESASEDIRRFIGKPFSNHQFFKVLTKIDDLKINSLVYFLIGLPKETLSSFDLLKSMIDKIFKKTRYAHVIPPSPYILDPNSLMAIQPEKYDTKIFFKGFENYYNMILKEGKLKDIWKRMLGYETLTLTRDDILNLLIKSREYIYKKMLNEKKYFFS